MVTQKDIADNLGVSIAVVSRALSGKAKEIGLSQDTVRKVLETADRMGYVPNANARILRGASSYTLGVLASSFNDPFLGVIIGELQRIAAEQKYSLVIEGLSNNTSALLKHQVNGLIIVGSCESLDWAEAYHANRIPCVCIGHTPESDWVQTVTVDEAAGFQLLVEHLLELGHQHLGFIGGNSLLHHQRQQHFRRFAADGTRDEWIVTSDASPTEAGREAAQALIEQSGPEKPSAIIAASDIRALGALRGLLDEGYSVPLDVALTGFDDIPLAEYAIPSLTTIRQPIDAICEAAFRTVTGGELSQVRLPPELVVRGSTTAQYISR